MVTSDAVQVMVSVMAPYIGDTLARSAAEVHCRNLGVPETAIDPGQIELVLRKLETGLHIFLGREKSTSVIADTRHALRAAGGLP
jgi:hypothetical protein